MVSGLNWAPSAMFAVAAALALSGVVAALTAANLITRLAGLAIALLGGVCALAAAAAPAAAQMVAAACGLAYVLIGAALVLRAQEAYHSLESPALDAADAAEEPADAHGS
jgi:hypothetical protein